MRVPPKCSALAAIIATALLLTTPRPGLTTPLAPAVAPAGAAGPEFSVELLRKSPYLIYPGDPSRMTVLWQLNATDTSRIEWGTDTTYALGSAQTVEYGSDHQHRITLQGLSAGTHYFYRVTCAQTARSGSFLTGPAADATRLEFLAYGDTRSFPAAHDVVAGAIVSAYTADPAYQTFTLSMGDLVNNGASENDWTTQFFSPSQPNVRRMMADLPYQACMGNHEGEGIQFVKYFPYPFVGGRYWSFDYGPAHFVVLDQYTWYGAGTAQLKWLTADLAASTKPWKFICLHEPGWSAGGAHPNNLAVQDYIQPLCLQYGVSIVFGGHNHYYARAVVSGIQHITTGGGGAPLETPNATYPNIVASASAYHFCKIELDAGTLRFRAVNTLGAVIDSFTLIDTVAPLATITSPVGGEDWKAGSVHPITWTATDRFGVSSVDLTYSTDGGVTFPNVIATRLTNTGSYPWMLPITPALAARVRIAAHDAAGNMGIAVSPSDFSISSWTVTASAGPGGGIAPSGAISVAEAATQAFTITPDAGYEVADVVVDGGSMGPRTSYTFTNVVSDHSIAATFALRIAFDFKPHDLQWNSRGRWVTGFLRPPAPFLASQFDIPSIRLNAVVSPSTECSARLEGPCGSLKLKFSRAELTPTLSPGEHVPVTVTGTIAGQPFVGTDYIRVKAPKLHCPKGGDVLAAGSATHVSWDPADEPTPTVTLLSSFDDGVTWKIEAEDIANTGSYTWSVPAVATEHARLAIVEVYEIDETGVVPQSEFAESDAFSIAAPLAVASARATFALRPSNPVIGPLTVSFSLAQGANATLDVYDVGGRRVASREVGSAGPGWHTLAFDDLAAGVYLVRLSQAGRSLTARVAMIR